MKYYISFLLFGLLALTFVSCNTDDLQKDVDALKDRVAGYETQVQQLNDEMNIVRVLLDGNKTITDYAKEGDTYTLTLSNGETLTLTPGVVGGNYPSIEIGGNGNWVIAGKDTGLRAKSEDGEDSTITPQFKVEANPADGGKKYWHVSYDEGSTWTVIENGVAEGVNSSTSPINKAEVVGSTLEVTLSDGTKHQLPIVKGLVCAINKPDGLVDGIWMVAGGGESSFTVKVNLAEGDLVRVKAPVEWKAKLSGNVAGSTEVTVTVTPPTTPSQCVIAVEVTHGVSTAADHLKVRTASDSYYADYNAGFDIQIGDLVINKYDYPGGQLVQDGGAISANGFYFLADGATVDWKAGTSDLIVLPEKKSGLPTLNLVGLLYFGNNGSSTYGVLLKGIKLIGNRANYSFNAKNTTKRVVFDHCEIEMMQNNDFSFFSSGGSVDEFLFESCRISIPPTVVSTKVLNFLKFNSGEFKKVTIYNNVFYCNTPNKAVLFALVIGTVKAEVHIENNTMINVLSNHGSDSGYLRTALESGWTVKSQLVWYDVDWPAASNSVLASMVSGVKDGDTISAADVADNKVFTTLPSTQMTWKHFRNGTPAGFANNIIPSTENPFESLSANEGKYVLKPEYKNIGATIE